MKNFKAPRKALTGLDAETVAGLIVASADIALVLDRRGVIRDQAIPNPELLDQLGGDWIGKSLIDTVTEDSRPKVELLLADRAAGEVRARQVNHPLLTAAPFRSCMRFRRSMKRGAVSRRAVIFVRWLRCSND